MVNKMKVWQCLQSRAGWRANLILNQKRKENQKHSYQKMNCKIIIAFLCQIWFLMFPENHKTLKNFKFAMITKKTCQDSFIHRTWQKRMPLSNNLWWNYLTNSKFRGRSSNPLRLLDGLFLINVKYYIDSLSRFCHANDLAFLMPFAQNLSLLVYIFEQQPCHLRWLHDLLAVLIMGLHLSPMHVTKLLYLSCIVLQLVQLIMIAICPNRLRWTLSRIDWSFTDIVTVFVMCLKVLRFNFHWLKKVYCAFF